LCRLALCPHRPALLFAALHYASLLAPQDMTVRLNSAMQHLRDGDLKSARRTLVPIAYNPDEGEAASLAGAEKVAADESTTAPEAAKR
jgi:cobalamin biosynthesis protein CobD/CbiB